MPFQSSFSVISNTFFIFICLENMRYIYMRLLFSRETGSCGYRCAPGGRKLRFYNHHFSLYFAYLLLFFPAKLKFMKVETGSIIHDLTAPSLLYSCLQHFAQYLEGTHCIYVAYILDTLEFHSLSQYYFYPLLQYYLFEIIAHIRMQLK